MKKYKAVCLCGRTIELRIYDDVHQIQCDNTHPTELPPVEIKTLTLGEKIINLLSNFKTESLTVVDVAEKITSTNPATIAATLSGLYREGKVDRIAVVSKQGDPVFAYIRKEVKEENKG